MKQKKLMLCIAFFAAMMTTKETSAAIAECEIDGIGAKCKSPEAALVCINKTTTKNTLSKINGDYKIEVAANEIVGKDQYGVSVTHLYISKNGTMGFIRVGNPTFFAPDSAINPCLSKLEGRVLNFSEEGAKFADENVSSTEPNRQENPINGMGLDSSKTYNTMQPK